MSTPAPLRLVAVSLAALALACGGVTSQSTTKLDTQGGQVALTSGLTLTVPPGALKTEVSVTVRETRHGRDSEIELEPRGLTLEAPATLQVSDDGSGHLERESGEAMEGHHQGGRLESQVSHFERLRLRHPESSDGGVDDHGGHGGEAGEDRDGGELGDDHGEHDGGEVGDDHGAHDGGEPGDDHGGMGEADGGTDGHGGGGEDGDAGVDGGVDGGVDDHGGHGGR